uniref:Uncharacterized protein n=1 Tax=Mustela putorius furo TaxID=9669 RepID=M3XY05_MUSPF
IFSFFKTLCGFSDIRIIIPEGANRGITGSLLYESCFISLLFYALTIISSLSPLSMSFLKNNTSYYV